MWKIFGGLLVSWFWKLIEIGEKWQGLCQFSSYILFKTTHWNVDLLNICSDSKNHSKGKWSLWILRGKAQGQILSWFCSFFKDLKEKSYNDRSRFKLKKVFIAVSNYGSIFWNNWILKPKLSMPTEVKRMQIRIIQVTMLRANFGRINWWTYLLQRFDNDIDPLLL